MWNVSRAWWGKGKSIRSSDRWPLSLLGQSLASSPLSLAIATWKWAHSQHLFVLFSQLSSATSDSAAPWTAARQASLSITSSRPNSLPSSPWCHPTVSSSVVPFSSCLQSFPASGSLRMSQFFTSCDRNSCCNEDEMRESLKNLKYPLDSKNQLLIIAESSVVVCVWNTSCELTQTQPIRASNLVLHPARPALLPFSAPLLLQSLSVHQIFDLFFFFFFFTSYFLLFLLLTILPLTWSSQQNFSFTKFYCQQIPRWNFQWPSASFHMGESFCLTLLQPFGPYNQSYGFSSSHVWMSELGLKEG